MSAESLGKRIKLLRKNAGFSQERFAEILGVSRTAVAKWENGYSEPTLHNIVSISEMLGVSSDYLLGISPTKSAFGISEAEIIILEKFINEAKNNL